MINVKDFGAKGDGITKDTAAIQSAINAGGMVYFPAGVYLSGTLYLKSNGGLYLENGAVLKASPDMSDYNADDFCSQNRVFEKELVSGAHFITAVEQENICICGGGRIDGNRQAFYGTADEKIECDRFENGHFPREELERSRRPGQMIFFCECKDVAIRDMQLYHAPYWTCFLHGCENVQLRGLRILNDQRTPNGDGIDIDCCCRVTVSDCIIDTGDDCITLRGSDYALKNKRPCELITVTNCVLHTNCNGIRIGVGNGTVRNAVFSNIVFSHCRTAVGITSNYNPDPAFGVQIENISFENLQIGAHRPFCILSQVRGATPEPAAKEIRNISFRHIRGCFKRSSYISGCAGTGIDNISFEDVELVCHGSILKQKSDIAGPFGSWDPFQPEGMIYISHAKNIRLNNVRISGEKKFLDLWKYAVITYNSKNVTLKDCALPKEILQG